MPLARDPWNPPEGRDVLAGIAVGAVLFAILVVYTHDVPAAPRSGAVAPFSVLGSAPPAPSAAPGWEDVPLATRAADLDPVIGRALDRKLALARPKLARCLGEAEAPRGAAGGRLEVVLRLAPRSGALHVEGIEAAGPGTPPDVIECARRVLDGDAIPAAPLVSGRRYRVIVALE